MSAICTDCGTDTTPCTGKRGCRHKGKWEWYMVRNTLWKRAGMTDGFLCVGCLENRIGRKLKPSDFSEAPVNDPDSWDTPRLADRKGALTFDDSVKRQVAEIESAVLCRTLSKPVYTEIEHVAAKRGVETRHLIREIIEAGMQAKGLS
jgi:hypothetical protein